MGPDPLRTFQIASAVGRRVPLSALTAIADAAGRLGGPRLMAEKSGQLARHIGRADPTLAAPERHRAAARGLGSYGGYWAESMRLPTLDARHVDRGFSVIGYDRVEASLAAGIGPILVLPHLGAWEWAAAWLGRVMGERVAAVVERLEPVEVFDWFVELRSAYGIEVIPVGPDAMSRLVRSVRANTIVCLLADRDITGSGIEVDFFGEKTMLPAGPALLARRTGAPLLPTAVYFRGRDRLGFVGPAVHPDPSVKLRDDLVRVTAELAQAMESLIEAAPDQWHLLEPNWPSDVGDT